MKPLIKPFTPSLLLLSLYYVQIPLTVFRFPPPKYTRITSSLVKDVRYVEAFSTFRSTLNKILKSEVHQTKTTET